MKILSFMTDETDVSKQRVLLLAGISGIANSLLLVILNEAATQLNNGEIETQLFAQYLITFILFIFAQRTSQREAVSAVEHALQKVRVRLTNKVRSCELRTIESLGGIGTYSSLTQGANTIAQSVMYLITGIESTLVLIFASLYLLWLSPPSFVIAITLISITIFLLVRHYQKTFVELTEASRKEGEFFQHFTAMLKGFKELKLSQRKSDEMFSHVEEVAKETGKLKSQSNVRLLEDILLSNITFYLLLLLVVFVMPNFVEAHEENLFQVIATILFMMEPVYRISAALPNVSKTNVAISGLYRLEEQLDAGQSAALKHSSEVITSFDTIRLVDASFSYKNSEKMSLFEAGPFDVTVNSGEVLFITGGNGSGKSTLLKLLAGLYQPELGYLYLDNKPISADNYPRYREMFSVVFNDFHLFDRLYGLINVPDETINEWLVKLKIDDKTQFKNGGFTNTDLSTGQRKRIAFIVAVIQDRPILVFDELAADQDPEFRQLFYEEIIPELNKQGKTIIAVTHDDRYFTTANRVLQMDSGQLREV
jgi:putative ATP-binding cassette transporter